MSYSIEIAQTIRMQIMAADKWALACWGAQNFVAFPESEEKGYYGGLGFTVDGLKYSGGVVVLLSYDDTYTIELIKGQIGKSVKIHSETGIYCDQLADIIDGLVER